MPVIFVFGSNLAGRHGKGAAKIAHLKYGAVMGRGVGLQGRSYAIPTKDAGLKTLPIHHIETDVFEFICFAKHNHRPSSTAMDFMITRIGCGLAGYKDEQIAPLFAGAPKDNCHFDTAWEPYLGKEFQYWGTYSNS